MVFISLYEGGDFKDDETLSSLNTNTLKGNILKVCKFSLMT